MVGSKAQAGHAGLQNTNGNSNELQRVVGVGRNETQQGMGGGWVVAVVAEEISNPIAAGRWCSNEGGMGGSVGAGGGSGEP